MGADQIEAARNCNEQEHSQQNCNHPNSSRSPLADHSRSLTMKILVTTPTGKVGQELVAILVKRGATLRLGAHSVDKTRAAFPDLEVVRLDHTDPTTHAAAVQGVDAVYLASPGDFPSAPEKALVDAAVKAGVKKVVKLAAMGSEHSDNPLRQVEEHVRASGLAFTFLHPTWFMQNYTTSMAGAVKAGTLAEPAADKKTAFIDARDIAAVAATVLLEPGHEGKTYTLTGPELLSRSEVAKILGQELGRPITYLPITDQQFRAAAKAFLSPSYLEVLSYLYSTVRAGQTEVKSDTVQAVLGRAPTSLARFAKEHRAVWA
jgi:uncharacterized protein YbjT (DUF2867 family)